MPDKRDLKPYQVGTASIMGLYPEVSSESAPHELRGIWRSLSRVSRAKGMSIEEGHLMGDHVHMLLSIPPKYSVAQVVGFIKGKAAIHIARTFMGRRKNYTGHHFGLGGMMSHRLVGMRR